jgi:hypothetical protein
MGSRPPLSRWPSAFLFAVVVAAFVASFAAAEGEPPQTSAERSGLYPMPGNAPVPEHWMPPGSKESPVPSDEIFPPQSIPLRFNHKKHVQELRMSCKSCHVGVTSSSASSDSLLPKPQDSCDSCHDVDHRDLNAVVAGTEPGGQCTFCHLGEDAGKDGRVARVVIPSPNLKFDHAKHLARNIDCGNCHGAVGELELATRDQLPRMAGCFQCHAMGGPSEGDAKGACTTCHLVDMSGRLSSQFATGPLLPPDWLHLAGHTPDWIQRHKTVAANDSQFCASCHKEEECADCHDGRVRNRKVHPNDWITMHATSARLDNPRCTSCHQLTSFCADCHRRVGVTRDGPLANRPAGGRFHPEPAQWTYAPRGSLHHAWEAQRNLNACVSCHSERDCATCHATRGVVSGGAGINPHPAGFASNCGTPFARNPRPCLVCHENGDRALAGCR